MKHDDFSDELLNAYVDGELDAEDQQRIGQAMSRDERLRGRVEELRYLKRLVNSAYVDETPRRVPFVPSRPRNVGVIAASIAAFVFGVALTWGWVSYQDRVPASRVAVVPDPGEAEVEEAVKVVFHLSRNDSSRMNDILTEAEALLSAGDRHSQPIFVRIIASGDGLSLLERGAAPPQAKRISSLKRDYESRLVFNGCGVAYKQLRNSRADGEFELLPEVQLVDLGVLELMRRQKQGWAYISL